MSAGDATEGRNYSIKGVKMETYRLVPIGNYEKFKLARLDGFTVWGRIGDDYLVMKHISSIGG